ncbi:MAG: KamA family radical SAM protein [Candidatus Eisenbacteria bacterium]|uniref:KamA family radical SAM protein n=1 Tax=Eiseniibacteriota bacterium TaxID=2212470 RepID=A0A937XCU4_UNCEI|nr:KamA family radical SAM protein [Candidatus Eisenbacteria bacterium]
MSPERYTPQYLLTQAPRLFQVARETDSFDDLRPRLRQVVHEKRDHALAHYDRVGRGLAIRIQDCDRVLDGMLRRRSERLADFSLTRALRDLARGRPRPDLKPAFYADLLHLLWGLGGRVRFESPADEVMAPSERSGREAAIERSAQLDRLWGRMAEGLRRHPSGLEPESIARRRARRERVRRALGASAEEWRDWRWHVRRVVRSARQMSMLTRLTEKERAGVEAANELGMPFGVTPYYASLMDDEPSTRDRAVRAQVLPPADYARELARKRRDDLAKLDFMREEDTSPIDLITRRYPGICILKPFNTCPQICVYCQRNWEIDDVMAPQALAPRAKLDAALAWIARHPAVREVLLTGGDPLVMGDARLQHIVGRLAAIPSVERIRIGTRTPITMPMRITPELAAMLGRHHEPGRREIAVVTHAQHAYEITPETITAVSRLRGQGIGVYNQMVFTFFNSRRFEAAALRRVLRLAGIDPYYTFNMKGKDEMADFRVPVARLLQEQQEEARLLPGLARTDEPVYNVPGLGKHYLRARQNRDLLAILPDGARVYEFHPWEKNITRGIRTYVGRDVPILEYLDNLARMGEDPDRYGSVWYYF